MPSPSVKKILNLPPRWLGTGLAVAVLGVSALFHGLAPVSVHETAPVVGTVIHGGPWDVTVVGGRILASQDHLRTTHDGARWFGVVAVVDITADDSVDEMSDIVRVSGVTGLLSAEPTRTILVRDASDDLYLNPGMPEKVAFLWEQASSAPVPASVDVVVYGETLRENSLTGESEWLDRTPLATVRAPVQDTRT